MARMADALRDAVHHYARTHADPDGIVPTPMPGMGMMRMEAPTGFAKAIYRPLVCLVLGGEK